MLKGVFDAHVHIIDPRFPVVENEGYTPDPFTVTDYRSRMDGYDVTGGAVIAGSFQGSDQSFLAAALAELGDDWVGVAQLGSDVTAENILELDRAGVRGIRFNLRRGATDIALLTHQALWAHELAGWHAELYVDGSLLASLEPVLSKLPAVSIDHLGMSESGLPYLLELVDRGARVKATGFGRLDEDFDIADALRRVHAVNPEALMFGSDLPGTRARRRFEGADLELISESVGDDLHAVLENNARAQYRLPAREAPLTRHPIPGEIHANAQATKPFPRLDPATVPLPKAK